ncbi:Pterin-4a-carbinolamine dehydratase [Pseudonocardia ammonioxydans]|uniref:Putative pterin-4-alpha-carbinolamine dehydratase n=1 Tax=Pseudonocardia ammonioxydans TaxID=260086 RepID=A0A1I5IAD7_PSUAM|nr:DUF2267 domain-containing protein [Pseudonocardia ammonioxydans]SFO57547.1 Pterin-4a-carbinolamine dehydratase [Pseudonocardia ammonioxydans]
MVRYETLVEGVRDRAQLDSGAHARPVVEAVLNTLAHELPHDLRERLADALPAKVEPAADVAGTSPPRIGQAFVDQVGETLGEPPERARYLAMAVLREIRAADADLAEALHENMPPETLQVLEPAGDPPDVATTVPPERPTRLTADEVGAALRALPDWTGDETGIARTVSLPEDRITPLVDQVQREARDMNDHAHVERGSGTVTFRLRTGSASVTEPDLTLARRVDAAVTQVASGG